MQCSFPGDSPQLSWHETQATGLSEELLDLFAGISQLILKGRSGEAVWGWPGGFLGGQKYFSGRQYGWAGWVGWDGTPTIPLDCPESLGKGGFQKREETQGEKTRVPVPSSQGGNTASLRELLGAPK